MSDRTADATAPAAGETAGTARNARYGRWVARSSPVLDRLALGFLVVFSLQWLFINPSTWLNSQEVLDRLDALASEQADLRRLIESQSSANS